jgi:chromate reductase
MSKKIGILVGSLRKASFSRSIALEMQRQLPATVESHIIQIGHLPLYNQDFEEPGQLPESYAAFRKEIEGYDGFLFITPEYNRSYTAVLKNALDVASRPYGDSKWSKKPAAVVSVSPGNLSGFGANHHLRQVLTVLNMPTVQQPEAYIGNVVNLLDEQGRVQNEDTRKFLKTVTDALVAML